MPLEGAVSGPIIKTCDPEEDPHPGPTVTLHSRVVDFARALHYSRVASMAGLDALSRYLHESAYESSSDRLKALRSAAEREVESASDAKEKSFEIDRRQILGRSFRVPSVRTANDQCPFLEVKVGIDAAVARSLLTLQRDELREETPETREINLPLVSMLGDGSAVSIVSRGKSETMDSNPLLDEYWKLSRDRQVKEKIEEKKVRIPIFAQ